MYEIEPRGYLVPYSSGSGCYAAIQRVTGDYVPVTAVWLGQTFFRNFYVSIEYVNDGAVARIAKTAQVPELSGLEGSNVKTLFAFAQLFVVAGFGIPVAFSLKQFLKD